MGNLCGGLRGNKNSKKFQINHVNISVVNATYTDVEVQVLLNTGEKPYETALSQEAKKQSKVKPSQQQSNDPNQQPPVIVEILANTISDEVVDTFKSTKHLLNYILKFTSIVADEKGQQTQVLNAALAWADDKKYTQLGITDSLFNITIDKKEQINSAVKTVEDYATARIKEDPLEVIFVIFDQELYKIFDEVFEETDARLNPKPSQPIPQNGQNNVNQPDDQSNQQGKVVNPPDSQAGQQ